MILVRKLGQLLNFLVFVKVHLSMKQMIHLYTHSPVLSQAVTIYCFFSITSSLCCLEFMALYFCCCWILCNTAHLLICKFAKSANLLICFYVHSKYTFTFHCRCYQLPMTGIVNSMIMHAIFILYCVAKVWFVWETSMHDCDTSL